MKVSDIRIYPIKSIAGILLNQAQVEPQGLANDRLMMLVDDNGFFITQRKYPQLALIKTQLREQSLSLCVPMFPELLISKDDFSSQLLKVVIWKDECSGYVANNNINEWFSKYLGFSVRLINYSIERPRKTDPNYSIDSDIVSFADGFPLLAIAQSSLSDLNTRLTDPVTMTYFRPNVVVEGCEAYAEDLWKRIKIGKVEFEAVKRCSRCVLTTINPNTGIKHPAGEPLKTLSNYRKNTAGVLFGMNLIARSSGDIAIGDKVEIMV